MKKKKALWAPCEGKKKPLHSLEEIRKLIQTAKEQSFTDLFVQLFRGGKTFYNSEVFEHAVPQDNFCVLETEAQEAGIELHAWINIVNAGLDPAQSFVNSLGSDFALRDNLLRHTKEIEPPFTLDTPGLWLEPSNPLLHLAISAVCKELRKFKFSSVHLDFIRYPYCMPMAPVSWVKNSFDFGYGKDALERFLQGQDFSAFFIQDSLVGIRPKDEEASLCFDRWRRQQIDSLVETAKNSSVVPVSAAILSWADRAYLNAFQNWRKWISEDIIGCLMCYTADIELFEFQIKSAQAFAKLPLYAGIGLYKLTSETEVKQQLEIVNRLHAWSILFSYDSL